MSYINTALLKSRGLSIIEHTTLSLASQNRVTDTSAELDFLFAVAPTIEPHLSSLQLIEYVKPTKTLDTPLKRLRASKKGREWLIDFSTVDVTENDLAMLSYTVDNYLAGGENRIVGNKKKIAEYIAFLRLNAHWNPYQIYYLIIMFIEVEIFTIRFEYIFFKKTDNLFGKISLDNCRLYQWYESNKEAVEAEWRRHEQCDFK